MKNTTKLFDKKQCCSCDSKVTVKRVCLICNEPSAIWCENFFKLEDFEHVAHTPLELF